MYSLYKLNFPTDVQGNRLYDKVQLKVTIKKDGFLGDVTILAKSRYPALDKKAIEIVRSGSPYAKFDPQILSMGYDQVIITRYVAFTKEGAVAR